MPSADAVSLDHALAAYDAGNGASAMPELVRLAQKYPGNFPANEALGLLYIDAGSYQQAIPFLRHAAEAAKTNAAAQANLGAAYLQTGDAHLALDPLRKAASLEPKNAEVLSNLGHALFLDKQPAEAAAAFARSADAEPANMDTRYNWALALHQVGKNTQADKALRTIPDADRTAAIESLWGDIAEANGQFKDAATHMQAAVKLNPTEQNIYNLAVEWLRHWTWQPAQDVAQYGIERFPDSRRLMLAKGIAFYGSGHYVDAANTFGALLKLDPENEGYGDLLGKSCSAAGGDDAAQCSTLIAFADKHPDNAKIAVYAAASILHGPGQQNDLDHVQQLLQRAIATDPHLPEAYYQLGVLEQQRLQWQQSVASLKSAIQLRPSYAEAHYRLARAYSHLHQTDLAAKEIALHQQYAQQEKEESDARLKEVTTFLIASH
ncbi:hypothetical protein GCM10011507_19050 [Edaphobacter acidisoli]|uniref:Tetratricopeptide repeat protein n=2 Tax=Edaphobacter acidisoli TaxID=2040573 RepID=A0A916RT38_9BACT|nr:hypothetical protein GCM10011507_19050 [Edaphobacter acidisoli]